MMKNIKLTRIIIPKTEMEQLNSKQLKRLIMFAFMIRDLSLLQKCLIYIHNEKPITQPGRAAKNTSIFFFLTTLLSKINEMWVFLKRNGILKELERASGNLASKSKEIVRFYSDNKTEKILAFIRDKFGFHYEYRNDVDDLISMAFKQLEVFEAWVSTKGSGNEIFRSSNSVALNVLFGEMKRLGYTGNEQKLMDILFALAVKAARLFRDFSLVYITDGLSIRWETKETTEIPAPQISETKLSLIVSN